MTPKKDEYMRGYGDGFKDGSARATEAMKLLKLIAEGYFSAALDDRFVRVENPKFREDNGEDPYVIYDTWAPEPQP